MALLFHSKALTIIFIPTVLKHIPKPVSVDELRSGLDPLFRFSWDGECTGSILKNGMMKDHFSRNLVPSLHIYEKAISKKMFIDIVGSPDLGRGDNE